MYFQQNEAVIILRLQHGRFFRISCELIPLLNFDVFDCYDDIDVKARVFTSHVNTLDFISNDGQHLHFSRYIGNFLIHRFEILHS